MHKTILLQLFCTVILLLAENSFKIQCGKKNLVSTSWKKKKIYEMMQFASIVARTFFLYCNNLSQNRCIYSYLHMAHHGLKGVCMQ